MTIAGRFAVALAETDLPPLRGPELLPVRLARACTRTLEVDGAGLSLVGAGARRVPLGASSDEAAVAERLQFTVGAGPCMTAQETRQPVFAVEPDLRRRWPVFADRLFAATPYRAVVALPLQQTLAGRGAVDLFFRRSEDVPRLDVFAAMAVGELVTSTLSEAAVWSEWSPAEGPDWLQGPAPRRRAAVWEAMGKVSVDLDVDVPAALELLRMAAFAGNRSTEDVADDLLAGRLGTTDLRAGDT